MGVLLHVPSKLISRLLHPFYQVFTAFLECGNDSREYATLSVTEPKLTFLAMTESPKLFRHSTYNLQMLAIGDWSKPFGILELTAHGRHIEIQCPKSFSSKPV
jgi:hypothetical protein